MIDEKIRRLLDSDLEDDNKLGWEMIIAKKVPFDDVVDYVNKSKVPTAWKHRYVWDGKKFVKNGSDYGSVQLGGWLTAGTTLDAGGTGTISDTGSGTFTISDT